ncbi:unnamed protein product [Cuscuta epithymum]|uniref:Uncharacterized protein n=1 Tax=Cuscuta epithymum TaxID=186058 RepID=A0AAV0BY94_9ASTE|nr:unnamed protein product [Cuscuta epithymum]
MSRAEGTTFKTEALSVLSPKGKQATDDVSGRGNDPQTLRDIGRSFPKGEPTVYSVGSHIGQAFPRNQVSRCLSYTI